MKKFNVSGMSCAACSAAVERAVKKVDGVTSCAVNLLTNSMQVEGGDMAAIISAVEKAGYGAKLYEQPKEDFADRETKRLKKRLFISVALLFPLLYFSMGHMLGVRHDFCLSAFAQLLLTLAIIYVNRKFFTSGFASLARRSPNMDSLVAIGASASFIYSCAVIFKGSGELYFESAAMILTLITVGKTLEARSKGKTTDALKGLAKLAPEFATVIVNGEEKRIAVSQIKVGDRFIVHPGEKFPADGEIIQGQTAVNEAALTGESLPVDKAEGDKVYTATINLSGFVTARATSVGKDTTLSKIIKLVSDAAAQKAPAAKAADRVSAIFVPAVICISLVTTIIWLLLGKEFAYALSRGISVLVISCPCALGLATPVAIMVGSGLAAKNGILFKTAAALEQTGKISCIALDKTGTLTTGKMQVTDVISYSNELETIAFTLESKSSHPIAAAIAEYFANNSQIADTDNLEELPGKGIYAMVNSVEYFAGNQPFIASKTNISAGIVQDIQKLEQAGKTAVIFAKQTAVLGIIAVADSLKHEAGQAVSELKQLGISSVMLSGDNKRVANNIASLCGIEKNYAELLPQDKEKIIRGLCAKEFCAMVGDGINDAPSLQAANIGIAFGKGTDIAADSSDVVLINESLLALPSAVRLSRAVLKNIHENLFWAFFYNALGIPLAAGLFASLGMEISPTLCAAAMSLSSFCVVTNALRLNFAKINSDKSVIIGTADDKHPQEETLMTKTIHAEGIMCPHCEARIKQALEQTDGVENAVVSHEKGTAVISLSKDISDDIFAALINGLGYKFINID